MKDIGSILFRGQFLDSFETTYHQQVEAEKFRSRLEIDKVTVVKMRSTLTSIPQ